MAVGIIIGAAFKAIVDSLVNDIISPLLGLLVNTNFNALVINVDGVSIGYGAFITAIINFLLMAFVLFLVIKAVNSMRELSGKLGNSHTEEPAPAPTTKVCPYCKSTVDIEASRCPNCTSELK